MLADASRASFHVIVTRDREQLKDPYECDANKKSGLHHVRYRQRREGLAGLALALGAIIAAMPPILTALDEADGQRLAHIAELDPNRRFDLTDPRKKPPSVYWPR